MSPPPLQTAAELLREYYGAPSRTEAGGDWAAVVRVVLEAGAKGTAPPPPSPAARISETLLAAPNEVEQAAPEEIEAALGKRPRARQTAAVLQLLARWWRRRFENRQPQWTGPLEEYQDELRSIRGVSVEMADRILLFAAGRAVYPLDRGSLRMACRHGWIGFEADYEEWQSFFVPGLERAGVDLRDFSQWAVRLGQDFCGPSPRCDQCPLRSLLPDAGPYEPDAE